MSPFRERPSICHKENRGTCLAEVRLSFRGQVYYVAMKNKGTQKVADVGLPAWSSRGFSITCDPVRVAPRPPSVDGLCLISCGLYSGDSEDTSRGTALITS
ncbi:hypothetical protein MTP99_015784 [Tenebrio molitor]|nr:hypothetical protein MTP99_015784 [Tenebrio molitor]